MRANQRRRVLLAAGALAVAPRLGRAQAAPKVWRIGILEPADRASSDDAWGVFELRLRELGYVEGKNLSVDRRWAEGADDRLPRLAQELLGARPDVVVVTTTPATRALMRLTDSVPIVMASVADPVATGLVTSLARPGGNVTGVSVQLADVAIKRIDLLLEIVPAAKRFGLLGPASNAGVQAVLTQVQHAIKARGLDARLLDAGDAAAIGRAFERLTGEPVDALLATSVTKPYTAQIVNLAARFRVPASYVHEQAIDAGGLIVYAPERDAPYRQAAEYVHRILRGAKPADLPVTQPTEFWLGVNLRTARALDLVIPQSMLLRANRVIPA